MGARLQAHARLLRLVREGAHPVHRLFDVLQRLHPVGAGHQLQLNHATAFAGGGHHFLDALDALHRLFHRHQHALLHFLGRGAGVGHLHFDNVELGFREDLFLYLHRHPQAAAEQQNHQQIGGDAVARHPLDRAHPALAARRAHSIVSAPAASSRRRAAPSTTVARSVATT